MYIVLREESPNFYFFNGFMNFDMKQILISRFYYTLVVTYALQKLLQIFLG